jgi:uncharacterized protein (TIGR04222 family)
MQHDPRPWNDGQRELWTRIAAHPIGGDAAHSFAIRLAREQGWTRSEAAEAIDEYRRFCFLAFVAGHEVTPSEEVDAVWHLHLLYTRDYWDVFCVTVLGAPLHHGPTRCASQQAHYRDAYARTLASYAAYFGAPSMQWWPGSAQRFQRKPAMTRIDRQRYWIVPRPRWLRRPVRAEAASLLAAALVAVPAIAAAALPVNPLEWNGGDFLALFIAAMVVAFVGSLILRAALRRQSAPPDRSVGELSVWEAAWLAGGAERVVDAGIAELHRLGRITVDNDGSITATGAAHAPDPTLDAILDTARIHRRVDGLVKHARTRLDAIRVGLERRGLWFERQVARRINLLSALPWIALIVLGSAKIAVGVARDRPVLFLVILTLVCVPFALSRALASAGRTPAGDTRLRLLNATNTTVRRAPRSDQLALAVALAGTSVLAGTALASYHTVRHPPSSGDGSSSGSDSGSDSGDSGGSSGCGGCGGGGGGD